MSHTGLVAVVLGLAIVLDVWAVDLLDDSTQELESLALIQDRADESLQRGRGRGRGRGGRSSFSAGGRFSLGTVNRAGNDEESELGEALTHADLKAQIEAHCGKGGSCTMEEIHKIWTHAWHAGYGSGAGNCNAAQPSDAAQPSLPTPARRVAAATDPSWGCQNDSVYFPEWIVRDQHSGCLMIHDPRNVNLDHLAKNLDHNSQSPNTRIWGVSCKQTRMAMSNYMRMKGFCNADEKDKKRGAWFETCKDNPDLYAPERGWDALEIDSDCGKYISNPVFAPPFVKFLDWNVARLTEGLRGHAAPGKPRDKTIPQAEQALVFVKNAADKVAGTCISRSITLPYGNTPVWVIPGQCLRPDGSCACTDGRPVPVLTGFQHAVNLFKIMNLFINTAMRLDQLVCYNPGFQCVVTPNDGHIQSFIRQDCETTFGKVFKKSGSNRSRRLGEANRWGSIKKTFKKVRKKASSKLRGAAAGGILAAARRILPKCFHNLAKRMVSKYIKGDKRIKASAEVMKVIFSREFRVWAAAKMKPIAEKMGFKSLGLLLDTWAGPGKSLMGGITTLSLVSFMHNKDFKRDWRRPWDGVFSQIVKATGVNHGDLGQFCGALVGLAKDRGAYEEAGFPNVAFDPRTMREEYLKERPNVVSLHMWVIKGKPRFWRRAASAEYPILTAGKWIYPKEALFSCMPSSYVNLKGVLEKVSFLNDSPARNARNRSVVWGCPDATPKLVDGRYKWISSGTGEDMVAKYDEKLLQEGDEICDSGSTAAGDTCGKAGLQCAHSIHLRVDLCDTCCCKAGLVSTEMKSDLVYGNKSKCGKMFGAMDGLLRVFISLFRSGYLNMRSQDMCLDPISATNTNNEVCQKFKCDAKKVDTKITLRSPSQAELDDLCGNYQC